MKSIFYSKPFQSLFALLIFYSFNANAQWSTEKIKGNGNVISKKINTADYDKILVSGSFDVNLVDGKEGNITIEGEENLIGLITIESNGGQLKIYPEKGKQIRVSNGKKILITVPFQTIDELNVTGSGNVTAKSTIKSTNFSTKLTGSGNLALIADIGNLEAQLTGSGNLEISGRASELNCKVTGSGNFSSYDLKSSNVDASVSGSGNSEVYCSGSLQAHVTGSGDIHYKGDPKKKVTKVSGSGTISKA